MSDSCKKCTDHLGKEFESIASMCRYWGVQYSTFNQRKLSGHGICECLTGIVVRENSSRPHADHLGQEFRTVRDMCEHWGITENMFNGRRKRGHDLRVCLTGEGLSHYSIIYLDHLGNKFKTIEDMCDHWNVQQSTFNERREKGYHIRRCLLGDDISAGSCVDHLGKEFKSTQEMCKYWGVSYDLYMDRVKSGCDLKTSLLGVVSYGKGNRKPCVDHLGTEFESVGEMCKYWGVNRNNFYWRLNHGYSIEQALTWVNHKVIDGTTKCKDHNNVEFDTIDEMCKAYGIKTSTYSSRLRAGHSLEACLTGKGIPSRSSGLKCEDHEGRKFGSVSEMCQYWKVNRTTFIARQEAGHSLEACLTGKGIKRNKNNTGEHKRVVKDHLGKEFKNYAEMCNYWEVKYSTFAFRKHSGYDLRTCLTWDKFGPIAYADHNGRSFDSVDEMCHYHRVDPQKFKLRRDMGYNLETSLNNEFFEDQPYKFNGVDPAIDAMVKPMVGFRDLADSKYKK